MVEKYSKLNRIAFHISMILASFLMLYPILWMVSGSLKTNVEIMEQPLKLIPEVMSLDSYQRGWQGFGGLTFTRFFTNSFVIATLSTIGAVFSASLVAYGFSRINFKGKKIWFTIMITTLMLPYQVIMVPQYILFQSFGWINTILPMVVPQFFGLPFFIFLTIQFIRGIPVELDESAYMDGASRLQVFSRILLPNIKPALVTVTIFSFYWRWNEFLEPLIYLSDPKKYTVSLALKAFSDPGSFQDWSAIFAIGLVSVLPVLLIFLFFQKQLVEGISTTGLKG